MTNDPQSTPDGDGDAPMSPPAPAPLPPAMRASVRDLMARLLQASDTVTVTNLVHDLESEATDTDDRRADAAYVLGQMGDARALNPLIAALRDEDTVVRTEAAAALGGLADRRAVAPLIRALYDAQWEVRSNAALSLGALADPTAIPHLIRLLDDSSAEVRFWTARTLGDLAAADALPALCRLAAGDPGLTPEGSVHEAAVQAIQTIAGELPEAAPGDGGRGD